MDRYFFSKIARGLKFTLSGISALACGTIIVCSLLGISTIAIPICGGIALLPAVLILVENTKLIADLEKNISLLKQQVKEFTLQVKTLQSLMDKYQVENNKFMKNNENLAQLLKSAEEKIDSLQKYLEEYKATNEIITKNLEANNTKLTQNVEELMIIKNQYEAEITELNGIVKNINQQMREITNLKEDMEVQLTSYQNSNQDLKIELDKVREMYAKSKEVIITLLKTKEIFEDVANDMVTTLSEMNTTEAKTQENVDKMTAAIEKYSAQRDQDMFQKLDKNQDGVISIDEFLEEYKN